MNPTSDAENYLVPAGKNHLTSLPSQFPEILSRAGTAAIFATDEFFYGRIRNEHTRATYLGACVEEVVRQLALFPLSDHGL